MGSSDGGAMRKIPSPEAIARARAKSAEATRNLGKVEYNLQLRFEKRCQIDIIEIYAGESANFRAYVFFDTDEHLEDNKRSGICQEIIDAAYEELERAGRGPRDQIEVVAEFESTENVRRNYGGSYQARMG